LTRKGGDDAGCGAFLNGKGCSFFQIMEEDAVCIISEEAETAVAVSSVVSTSALRAGQT